MDIIKKILFGTFVIFTILIGIFGTGNLFGTSTLLITALLVLFLLFYPMLFVSGKEIHWHSYVMIIQPKITDNYNYKSFPFHKTSVLK